MRLLFGIAECLCSALVDDILANLSSRACMSIKVAAQATMLGQTAQ